MEDSVESLQLKGCFVSIVRIKNMFNEIKQWDMNDLSHCHYCDLKANCLIQVNNKKMIVEVQVKCFIVLILFLSIISMHIAIVCVLYACCAQFIVDFMQKAKDIGHVFYSFVRNGSMSYLHRTYHLLLVRQHIIQVMINQIIDLYQEIANLFNESKDKVIDASKQFELMLATQDFTKLRTFVLFGNLQNMIEYNNKCKNGKDKIDFNAILDLYKSHNWEKGYKLLRDGIDWASHKNTK